MIYPLNILAFVDDKNRKIVTNFACVLFNTQMKALKHDDHTFTLKTGMLTFLLHHKKALECISGEANMITVPLL